ncbi:hypothetical protein TNCV_616701 [Trichonephila clavipes]|nr:hypothetical protein TNCV_616701 [Trichonephila clavipes]
MREKGDNRLVSGPDYMVDALKLPNQAPRSSGESLQKCVFWRFLDGTQHLFCWPILAISSPSLASNGSVVDSRDLNLVFGYAEVTPNKRFLSSPTKFTVELSWPLVLQGPRSTPVVGLEHHTGDSMNQLGEIPCRDDRWRLQLSPPQQFRHGTAGEENILQSPALVIQPTRLRIH